MHEVEGGVDVFEAHDMRDHGVDLDLAGHVHINNLGHIGAALGAAKGRTPPIAPCDKLEGTRCDFLARFSDPNDDAGAPAAMARFQRLAHHSRVAGRVERVVGTTDLIGAALCIVGGPCRFPARRPDS